MLVNGVSGILLNMNQPRRRSFIALLAILIGSTQAPAQQAAVSRVSLTPSLGGAWAVPGLMSGAIGGPTILALPPMLKTAFAGLTPLSGVRAQPAATVLDSLASVASIRLERGDAFDGRRARTAGASGAVAPPGRGQAGPKNFLKNTDGVWVGGRVAEQALWIGRMHEELAPHVDLADVMNVMDDAYDEARVKLMSVERAETGRRLTAASVHLEGTRNWVDAILTDSGGRSIAVHTHRVYFHPAPGNPASEIGEGIRRVDKYLEKAKYDFAAGGLAERDLGKSFTEVELNFDTRGYQEIADHLRRKEQEFRSAYGDRFKFNYITEPRMASRALRAEYNRLVERYRDQPEGVMSIVDGVTYSREVGVGHELNSHKKRIAMGLRITQAGRDFFGKQILPDGRVVKVYKTEFDAKTEPFADAGKPLKERDITLWEDKSARVWMPLERVMEETFLYKLRIYRDNREIIEEDQGGAPLKVAFSVDVGGLNREAAKQGFLVWRDLRQKALMEHLKAAAPALSAEYGFPISFVFINSHPGEDMDIYDKTPMTESVWTAMKRQNGRKHGRS
jgi:hypothetical protein